MALRTGLSVSAAIVVLALQAPSARGQGFVVGTFPVLAPANYGWSVSNDGGVATGFGWAQNFWTRSQGFRTTANGVQARAVSGDGSTLVGSFGGGGTAVALWTGTLAERGRRLATQYATGASFDGSVISVYGPRGAWNPDTGATVLTVPQGSFFLAAVSADGSVMVGEETTYTGNAARFDAATGVGTPLGGYQGGSVWARAVSADGSTIVGVGVGVAPAVRWTVGNGWQPIGPLPGMNPVTPGESWGVSANGQSIVGQTFSGTTEVAFLWTAGVGTRDLNVLLLQMGVDLEGWMLTNALGISGDGSTIVGLASRTGMPNRVFIATIPTPGVGVAVVICAGAVVGRRRRGAR